MNRFGVGTNGEGKLAIAIPPRGLLTRDEALNLAVWLITLGDFTREQIDAALREECEIDGLDEEKKSSAAPWDFGPEALALVENRLANLAGLARVARERSCAVYLQHFPGGKKDEQWSLAFEAHDAPEYWGASLADVVAYAERDEAADARELLAKKRTELEALERAVGGRS